MPIVIGGRSDAALRRVARYGDGWLGLWVSPARYAGAVGLIGKYAADDGRDGARGWQHGMHVWCGLGASACAARARLSAVMEEFYRTSRSANSSGTARAARRRRSRPACSRTWTRAAGRST